MKQAAPSPIQFHYPYNTFSFTKREALKRFLVGLFKREKVRLQGLTYVFCSDEYLLGINQSFLQHDTYTDIVTFPLSGKGEPVLGEIYISVERVRENAQTFGTGFNRELHRVIFHGALHLCGYKDKSKAEASLMRLKEDEYLSRYFVPRGTREV
jgi:probable rRNA maturation factor